MKSFLIIGMGRFGKHLGEKLIELNNDVVIIDKDDEIIEKLAPNFTDAFVGDCRNENVLRSLGVNNFDVCFVCIAEDFQSSLEITSMLKEFGAKYVVSTAKRDRQSDLLKKIGADDVIYAEKQIAIKTGIRYNANNIVDLIMLTDDYAIYEIPIKLDWVGKTIIELDVRKKYNLNIIAIKNGENVTAAPHPDYRFSKEDNIMVIGTQENIYKFTNK